MMALKYDVIIIGGGVTGAAAARELARYQVNVCLLEKEEDVCCGTSKANSAIVHAGYDAKEGSLMARLNVRGNQMMEGLARELDIPFQRNGSMVVCLEEEELPGLVKLYHRGLANGVPCLRILNRQEALDMEPNLTEKVFAALYAPTAGIICPFQLNIALAENALVNGVDFSFETEVTGIVKIPEGYRVRTNKGDYTAGIVVNAAGVYADVIHNMVSEKKLTITARRGEYCLLDKKAGAHVAKTIFPLPGKYGKGILAAPTIHGNLILGQTAQDTEDKEGVNTTKTGLCEVIGKAGLYVKNIPMKQVITSFAGLRTHEEGHEFIIGEPKDAEGFIDCAGIESPGLTSSPAIGEMVAGLIRGKMELSEKTDYTARRKGILNPTQLEPEERKALIQKNPEYGNIICRCEMISEGEILDAIRRPLGAKSLDGVKRKTRAGAGRCQGGFCLPRVMELIARENGKTLLEVTKHGGASRILTVVNKDAL